MGHCCEPTEEGTTILVVVIGWGPVRSEKLTAQVLQGGSFSLLFFRVLLLEALFAGFSICMSTIHAHFLGVVLSNFLTLDREIYSLC